MKTDRRSLLRFLGLGAAAGVGETVPGLGKAWLYAHPPQMPPSTEAMPYVTTGYAQIGESAAARATIDFNRKDYFPPHPRGVRRQEARILWEARRIEREREYAMTDWGGAL